MTVAAAKMAGDMTSLPDAPPPASTAPSSVPIILDGWEGDERPGGGSATGRADREGAGRGGGRSTPSDRLFAGLNPQQREAAEYRGAALLIVAGAGSGKTSVLTRRIAGLIESREAWPSEILAITFTNKAANEMRERVEQLLGGRAQGMWISTFHSACVRILRREAETIGKTQSFTIYDSGDTRALLKRIIKELDADTLGFTVAGAGGPHLQAQERAHRHRDLRALGQPERPAGGDVPRDLPAVHARAPAGERVRLRRPHRRDGVPVPGVPEGGGALPDGDSGTSWSTSTRTPTTPSTRSSAS